jgi:hypothetical protein
MWECFDYESYPARQFHETYRGRPMTFDDATPPGWCEPGTVPLWQELTDAHGGCTVVTWIRDFGPVWIECEDRLIGGRLERTPTAIHYPPRGGLDPAAARRLAAELLNAADILDPPKSPARGYGRPRHP